MPSAARNRLLKDWRFWVGALWVGSAISIMGNGLRALLEHQQATITGWPLLLLYLLGFMVLNLPIMFGFILLARCTLGQSQFVWKAPMGVAGGLPPNDQPR